MGASMRVWIRRVSIFAVLQLVVALPLLRAALPDIEPRRESEPYEISLGAFRRTIELGAQDYRKTFVVEVVIHLEGTERLEVAPRAVALLPKLRDAVRVQVARLDHTDMGTLRGREKLKLEVTRVVEEILETGDFQEVLFEKYALQ